MLFFSAFLHSKYCCDLSYLLLASQTKSISKPTQQYTCINPPFFVQPTSHTCHAVVTGWTSEALRQTGHVAIGTSATGERQGGAEGAVGALRAHVSYARLATCMYVIYRGDEKEVLFLESYFKIQ